MTVSYTELMKNLSRQEDARDREEMSRDSEPAPFPSVPDGPANALLRHAGELDFTVTPTPAYLTDLHIEVQGSQFIDSVNYLLDYFDWAGQRDATDRRREAEQNGVTPLPKPPVPCPPHVRHLITAICGLSGGDYLNFNEITQKEIAERLGIKDLKTVREHLDQLYEWERQNDRACVQVWERDREPGQKKYPTALYRPVIVFYAAEFIRRLKARGMRPVHQQHKLNGRAEELIEQVVDAADEEIRLQEAEAVRDEMPPADVRRKDKKPGKPKGAQPRMRFLEEREMRVLKAVSAWAKALKQSGYPPLEHAAELYEKIDAAVRAEAASK